MKLIRGFVAYSMWIRWVENVGGDVGGTDRDVGGPKDLEAALKDVRKSLKNRRLAHFRICCFVGFFSCTEHCNDCTDFTSLEARVKLSTTVTNVGYSQAGLGTTEHKKQGCDCFDCLLACDALFKGLATGLATTAIFILFTF